MYTSFEFTGLLHIVVGQSSTLTLQSTSEIQYNSITTETTTTPNLTDITETIKSSIPITASDTSVQKATDITTTTDTNILPNTADTATSTPTLAYNSAKTPETYSAVTPTETIFQTTTNIFMIVTTGKV